MIERKGIPSALFVKQQNNERLEIFTLGQFLVRRGEKLLSEDAGRSYHCGSSLNIYLHIAAGQFIRNY